MLNTASDLVSETIKIPLGPPQYVSFPPAGRTAYVSVYNTKSSVHLSSPTPVSSRNCWKTSG